MAMTGAGGGPIQCRQLRCSHSRPYHAAPPRAASEDQQHDPTDARSPRRARRHRDARRLQDVAAHVENRADRAQFRRHRRGRLVPLIEALRHRPGDDPVELDRQCLVDAGRRRGGRLYDLQRAVGRRRACEGQASGHHLEQDDAEREDVGAVIAALAKRLLRRHVRHRRGRLRASGCLGQRLHARDAARRPRRQAEIEQLRVPLRRDEDVVGREVAVNEARCVRVGERIGDLDGQIDRTSRIERASGDGVLQRLPRDVLEHEEQLILIFSHLVQRGDIGVRQDRGHAGVLHEPRATVRIAGDVRRQHLDRHGPSETGVAGTVDLAQAAGADAIENLVVAEGLEHGTATIILTVAGRSRTLRDEPVSYISILRNNRNFRLLYIGQTISQLGDWFNAVAVYALLLDLTGSATAVAWMMIVQFLPVAIFGPLAGVVVDRVNRRRLMIATDLLRGVMILDAAVHPAAGSGVDRVRGDGVRGRRRRRSSSRRARRRSRTSPRPRICWPPTRCRARPGRRCWRWAHRLAAW